MELLDEKHTDLVWQAICKGTDGPSILTSDLLDHFCCFIEEQMSAGADFNSSLSLAILQIIPNGVQELEQELALMNTLKPQKKMKQLFYISTFVCSFSLIFSLLARHWNWHEGVTVFTLAGNISLLIFVLPLIIIMAVRNRTLLNLTDIIRMILGVASGALIALGMLFKFMYFPMANYMVNAGMLLLLFLFMPLFFYQLYKRSY